MILTGDKESPVLPDLELPMSSFQGTLRNGEPSYLSCVIPNSRDYADAIIARSHGEIIVKKGYRFPDGREVLEELARVNYESLQIDRGAFNDSATISGHKTVTSSAPKEWRITGLSYYGLQAEGSRRIRGDVDTFLRCGDTVLFDLEGVEQSFIVGDISYNVSVNQAYMDVTEAWETVPEVPTPSPEPETSQEYELVGPGVIAWNPGHWVIEGEPGFYGSDPGGGIHVMIIFLTAWSVLPVDPDNHANIYHGARGIESPVFVVVDNASIPTYGIASPGNGCTFTVAADYTVAGRIRTATKSVVLTP